MPLSSDISFLDLKWWMIEPPIIEQPDGTISKIAHPSILFPLPDFPTKPTISLLLITRFILSNISAELLFKFDLIRKSFLFRKRILFVLPIVISLVYFITYNIETHDC